ncbi:hypothetical protein BDV97DRAFT_231305 [Delphinella strobiligena]|nr:hypothetical protein BDV97DRAFT_231305 [Delphinella strobiligena]
MVKISAEWWAPLALIEYAATNWFIHHSASNCSLIIGHHDSISQICDPSSGIYECWTPHVPEFNFNVASPARLLKFSTLNGYSFIADSLWSDSGWVGSLWMSAMERKWTPLAEDWCAMYNKITFPRVLGSECCLRNVQWSAQMLDRVFDDALQTGGMVKNIVAKIEMKMPMKIARIATKMYREVAIYSI